MLRLSAGVPLMTMSEIKGRAQMAKTFATDARLIAAYNNWIAAHGVNATTLSGMARAHTRQYLNWRGSRLTGAGALEAQPFYKRAGAQEQRDMKIANADLSAQLEELRERQRANVTANDYWRERARDVARTVYPVSRVAIEEGKAPLNAIEQELLPELTGTQKPPEAVGVLFDEYVHDSRAGFIVVGKHEPRALTGGYVRYRTIFDRS
jgi:hypothetical protein